MGNVFSWCEFSWLVLSSRAVTNSRQQRSCSSIISQILATGTTVTFPSTLLSTYSCYLTSHKNAAVRDLTIPQTEYLELGSLWDSSSMNSWYLVILDDQRSADQRRQFLPQNTRCRSWAGLWQGRQHRMEEAELSCGKRGQHKGLLLLVAQVTLIPGRIGKTVFYPKHYIQQSHLLVQTKQKVKRSWPNASHPFLGAAK